MQPGAGSSVHIEGNEFHLERHDELPDEIAQQVGLVGVLAFTADGKLAAVVSKRGVDIPSGHVEPDDSDPESALRREAREEAKLTLGPLTLVTHFFLAEKDDLESGT